MPSLPTAENCNPVSPVKRRSVAVAGPFGPPQLACLRSWRQLGLQTVFLHFDQFPLAQPFWGVADRYCFLGEVRELTNENCERAQEMLSQVDAVVSVSEALTKTIWQLAEPLRASLCVLSSPPNLLDKLESKSWQARVAASVGFNVLPTATFAPADAEHLRWEEYPAILRPDRARAVKPLFKGMLCRTHAELISFCKSLQADSSDLVLQPYKLLPSLCVHAYRDSSGEMGGHVGFLAEFRLDGVSVGLVPHQLPRPLVAACRQFEETVGLAGAFHYDLLSSEETQSGWFLEVNPRLGGTTAKVLACGYDEPANLLAAFGLIELSPPGDARLATCISRIAATRFLRTLLCRQLSELDYPKSISVRSVIKLLMNLLTAKDEVLRLNDLTGTMALLSQRN